MGLRTNNEQIQERRTADSPAPEVHLLDVLTILWNRRLFISWFTLGAAAVSAISVLLIPSMYTATTLILPPSQSASAGTAMMGQLVGSGGFTSVAGGSLSILSKNPGDLYVSLFRSRTVEDSVIQRFGLMGRYGVSRTSDARVVFESHSKIVLGTKNGLITLSVTDREPKQAAAIANGYVDELNKLSASLAITEASQRRLFFQQQLLEANENLAAAEEAMKSTQQTTGILQIDSQAKSLIDSAAILRGQIAAKEVQLQAMRSYATEDNPKMVVADQELTALKVQLGKLAGADRNSSSDIIVPKGNIPEAGMEYVRKLRDVKYFETIAELLAKQYEMAKLDEAHQGYIIQVIDPAVPPDKRSFPKRAMMIIAGILLGFFAACGWCIFAEGLRRQKIDSAEHTRSETLEPTRL
jgi:uncharacterized protein involved in exopolysaccharide biosynthesis